MDAGRCRGQASAPGRRAFRRWRAMSAPGRFRLALRVGSRRLDPCRFSARRRLIPGLGGASGARVKRRRLPFIDRLGPNGQLDHEAGAQIARARLVPETTVVRGDDAERNGQSQPGPFARLFGGEERIEQPPASSFGDARSVVANGHSDTLLVVGQLLGLGAARAPAGFDGGGGHPQMCLGGPLGSPESLNGVDREVQEDLLHLRAVEIHLGQILGYCRPLPEPDSCSGRRTAARGRSEPEWRCSFAGVLAGAGGRSPATPGRCAGSGPPPGPAGRHRVSCRREAAGRRASAG